MEDTATICLSWTASRSPSRPSPATRTSVPRTTRPGRACRSILTGVGTFHTARHGPLLTWTTICLAPYCVSVLMPAVALIFSDHQHTSRPVNSVLEEHSFVIFSTLVFSRISKKNKRKKSMSVNLGIFSTYMCRQVQESCCRIKTDTNSYHTVSQCNTFFLDHVSVKISIFIKMFNCSLCRWVWPTRPLKFPRRTSTGWARFSSRQSLKYSPGRYSMDTVKEYWRGVWERSSLMEKNMR